MPFRWEYPVYVIPLGGGFASVVDQANANSPLYALAVFTQQSAAARFMAVCEIPGDPRQLDRAHEFAWLLQSLQAPVIHVAFDPAADQHQVAAAWMVPVDELLKHDLLTDRSPWKYPVFVIRQPTGFASIEGGSNDGLQLTAVCLFTEKKLADDYIGQNAQSGEIQTLGGRDTVRKLLETIPPAATAVALDPIVQDGCHSAKYCIAIETLIEKYLTAELRT